MLESLQVQNAIGGTLWYSLHMMASRYMLEAVAEVEDGGR
jgi:hypothetical protein